MNPSEGFWEGVGASVGNSPGWMVIGALLVIGVLFIVAKYIVPSRERIRTRELDIREREAQNDADRIKANAALAENMRGLQESNDNLAQQNAAMTARLNESATRSREMGGDVADIKDVSHHIRETTDSTHEIILDIKQHIIRGEGTD